MGKDDVLLLFGLVVVYAPFLVAYGFFRSMPGCGVWKFLAFVCCTLAVLSAFVVHFGVGLVLWLIAWLFAGITRHAARREAVENATLKAMQEQNELLKQKLLTMQEGQSAPL
jgi:hypothetical protein